MIEDHFVNFQPARILVADDDPILREFASVHLGTPSVEIEVAEDGVIALEKLSEGRFDLALVDLSMPRMDGFELISHVRETPKLAYLPMIVATGREDMEAVDRAYAMGATGFVVKPLNWRVLSHQLAYTLRNARAEADLRRRIETQSINRTYEEDLLALCRATITRAAGIVAQAAAGNGGDLHDQARRLCDIERELSVLMAARKRA